MDFPKGTIFRDEVDPETGQKIKVAILPDGTELKFYTEEDLDSIQKVEKTMKTKIDVDELDKKMQKNGWKFLGAILHYG